MTESEITLRIPLAEAPTSTLGRWLVFAYGILAYVAFLLSLGYFIAFTGGYWVPKTVDDGDGSHLVAAVLIDLALISLFAVSHSIMARASFKRWWARIIPETVERSTYVLTASAFLGLLVWLWRPLPGMVWRFEQPLVVGSLWGLHAYGWMLLVWASFMIDHFDLFGLRHVYLHLRGRPYTPVPFQVGAAYRYLRHPMMVGITVGLFATPQMTLSHLFLASTLTLYTIVGVLFEERGLCKELGEPYRRYRQQVPAILPRLVRRRRR